MADSFQEKTEKPTDKRLDDAREKGKVAKSPELSSCFIILFSSIFVYFTFSRIFQQTYKTYMHAIQNANMDISVSNVFDTLSLGLNSWLKIVVPVFVLLMAVGMAANIIQIGFRFSPKALRFDFGPMNPIKGLGKFFKLRSLQELAKSLLKIVILGVISYSLIRNELPAIMALPQKETAVLGSYIGRLAFMLALKLGIVFMFLAALDYFFQKWQFTKDMMMTKQEVIEESKEREGNPLVKSRIRSLQREFSRRRMLEDVRTADVIVTNPTTYAVALSYKAKDMAAPKVVAKGAGFVADKIKSIARLNGIPIMENKPLAQALFFGVKIGDYIPEKFYLVVAELLAQVYRIRKRAGL
jgi:flagellar biosynthesis protein FlhB